jgi:hypothetical protein
VVEGLPVKLMGYTGTVVSQSWAKAKDLCNSNNEMIKKLRK